MPGNKAHFEQYLQDLVTVCGLTSNGYLKAESADGGLVELHPDGTSVDLMAGMLRRKLSTEDANVQR